MKRILLFSGLFLTLCFIWADCKKNDEAEGCDVSFMEADINGSKWTALEVKAIGLGNGPIHILGQAENGAAPVIKFDLPYDIKTGPYDLTQNYSLVFTSSTGGIYFPWKGVMNVSLHDTIANVIRGTFEFTTEPNDFIVNNGSFCVKY